MARNSGLPQISTEGRASGSYVGGAVCRGGSIGRGALGACATTAASAPPRRLRGRRLVTSESAERDGVGDSGSRVEALFVRTAPTARTAAVTAATAAAATIWPNSSRLPIVVSSRLSSTPCILPQAYDDPAEGVRSGCRRVQPNRAVAIRSATTSASIVWPVRWLMLSW